MINDGGSRVFSIVFTSEIIFVGFGSIGAFVVTQVPVSQIVWCFPTAAIGQQIKIAEDKVVKLVLRLHQVNVFSIENRIEV